MRREPEGLGRFYRAEAAVFARYGLRTQQRLVDLPESGIRVRIVETGTGAPTLLLHGFSLTTAHWAPLMAQLPGRRLIALDMPGHGASDGKRFDNTDLRRWFDTALTAVLTGLGLTSVDVIGHSQGAILGMFLALDQPERVRQVIATWNYIDTNGAWLDPRRYRLTSAQCRPRTSGPLSSTTCGPDPYSPTARDTPASTATVDLVTNDDGFDRQPVRGRYVCHAASGAVVAILWPPVAPAS